MDFKRIFGGFLGYFILVFMALLLVFISLPHIFSLPIAQVSDNYFFNKSFTVFVALLIWLISPVGVLSVMIGIFRVKKYSPLKNKIVALSEFFSMISWFSFMAIMMIVYADSSYFKILNLGSDFIYLALVSGFVFGFLIVLKVSWRKLNRKSYYKSDDYLEGKLAGNCCFCSGHDDSFSGFRDKIKYKIKQEIKNIINEEIDRRF